MANTQHRFIHRYVPAASKAGGEESERRAEGRHALLLLHGTGGDENQLLELGHSLAPGAALLSPRGQVLENGMARFFRRVSEGVFDVEDLVARTHQLAAFITEAQAAYEMTGSRFVAVGFSNGANMVGSLLLLYPKLFAGAVLYRPMVPFVPDVMPDLDGVSVLVVPGERDRLVRVEESERFVQLLQWTNAFVQVEWQPGGHGLTDNDIAVAHEWLDGLMNGDPN